MAQRSADTARGEKSGVRSVSVLVLACAGIFPVAAAAAEIFACTLVDSGKTIALHEEKGVFRYVYGSPGKPDASVSVPRQRVRISAWNGVDQYHTYLVSLRDGGTVYTVYTSYDEAYGYDSMGVTVEHNDVFMGDLKCRPGSHRGDLVDFVLNHQASGTKPAR